MIGDILPRVRRSHRTELVAGEAIYLISEGGHQVIEGDLVERVVPLLDGKHDIDDVLDLLADVAPERVLYLIERLIQAGVAIRVAAAGPQTPERDAAYWDLAGGTAEQATARLAAAHAGLTVVGEVDPAPILDALRDVGVAAWTRDAIGGADLHIVLTDDYLQPELARHNRDALAAGTPWLLAKPVGSVLWIGPVFTPGVTGCWACLSTRLAGHRPVEEYLRSRAEQHGPLRAPLADLDLTRGIGARLTALEAAKFLAGVEPQEAGVLTFDTIKLDAQRHPLHRRPQCVACGDPGLIRARFAAPVSLTARPKGHRGDGGHRAVGPDEVLGRFGGQVSSVTGVVRELKSFDTGLDFVKGYYAGHNVARQVAHLRQLRNGLRSLAAGKGVTDTQARASAICEAIERHSGLYTGEEPRIMASLTELGEPAIAPNEIQRYSQRQYDTREAWNAAQRSNFQIVCDPLPADEQLEWSPVWSLTDDRHRYLPTAALYFQYPSTSGKLYAWACSNGNAAGASLEDAILQGFFELVERDSVALWWYNMASRPAYDLDSFAEPWFDEFQEVYAGLSREVWVLDVTADLGVPAAAAISRRTDKPAEDILIGLGAHYDPKIAVQRALSELNQFLPAVLHARADGTGYAFPDPVQQEWWREATIANQPYLAPKPGRRTAAGFHRDLSSPDLRTDVQTACRLVAERGMQLLVADQTRPDIELPVVKVIVPGLRHFWARLGPGRLYDVPVTLGWQDRHTPEDRLNPIPMFL